MRTHRTMKGAALLSAFVLPLTLLSACSSGGSGSESGAAQTAKMYTWVSSEADRAQWQAFVDAAKEQNPQFELEFEGPSFADYFTKVKTRMIASDAPCLLTTQAARPGARRRPRPARRPHGEEQHRPRHVQRRDDQGHDPQRLDRRPPV